MGSHRDVQARGSLHANAGPSGTRHSQTLRSTICPSWLGRTSPASTEPNAGGRLSKDGPVSGPEIVLKKQSGAAKRGSRTLSLHRDGNAADRRRHFGTHLRAAELQDNAFRILQLNAAGTACDGTTRTGRCVAACKVAGAVEI